MFKRLVLMVTVSLLVSCTRDEPVTSGDGGYRYQANEFINLSEDAVIGQGRIYVDNVSPYEDMFGEVLSLAFDGTTNGNDERISDVSFENVRFTDVKLDFYSEQLDSLEYHFKTARLFLGNADRPNDAKEVAVFQFINAQDSELQFSITSEELSEWMETNRPDEMYFEYELKFLRSPKGPLDVRYDISMEFEYSYESSEDR